jgi:hypothetical protein
MFTMEARFMQALFLLKYIDFRHFTLPYGGIRQEFTRIAKPAGPTVRRPIIIHN